MTSSLVDDELFIARDDCAAAGPALLEKLGVFAVCDAISSATLVDLQEAATARLDEVLKYRSQHYAAGTMGNGVWKELCCRDGDRFDVHYRMSEAPFAALGTEGSWCAAVREILGADAKLLYTGQIVACGCDAIDADDEANQKWHMDGDHLDEVLYLPCHCLTVFVPLVDLCADNGATEFSLGSHKHECEDLGERVLECSAGSAIIFDYRTLHRGTANRTTADRPILYFTYSRSWFEDPVNYRHVNQHKSILEGGSVALAMVGNGDDARSDRVAPVTELPALALASAEVPPLMLSCAEPLVALLCDERADADACGPHGVGALQVHPTGVSLMQHREHVCFYFPHHTRSNRSGRGVLEEELVGRRGFETVTAKDAAAATLLWASAFPSTMLLNKLMPSVRLNHFPRSTELSHKQRLYANARVANASFFAPSFVLPAQLAVLREALDAAADAASLWIIKPGKSGSGKNVRVVTTDGVRRMLDVRLGAGVWEDRGRVKSKAKAQSKAERAAWWGERHNHVDTRARPPKKMRTKIDPSVVSRYIANPLLIRGRKVDLRAYVLILRCACSTHVFLYADGLVRFAAEPYCVDPSSLADECVHLTNNTVSRRRGPQHGAIENETWGQLKEWMARERRALRSSSTTISGGSSRACEPGMRWDDVWSQLKNAAFAAVRDGMLSLSSTQGALSAWPERTAGCFELLGFDFLIDIKGKVWLLEVNSMPELEMTPHAAADRDVNARLVPDLFDLVLGNRTAPFVQDEEGRDVMGFVDIGAVEDS